MLFLANSMRLQDKACAKGDEKLNLRKHVASQHVLTCFSKATVTRPDNRTGKSDRKGYSLHRTTPFKVKSIEFTDVT